MLDKIKQNRKNLVTVLVALAIAFLAHGFNMFQFPYYENDEGTYMAQAWSLVTQGKLAPYTYWYDHAPAGWIFIALWTQLTGGFSTFGFALNSGRVFMLVLHLFSSVLLFGVTQKLTKRTFTALVAVLLFSLSPLAIFFQRRVLLDNIMVFWLLLALYLILGEKRKLSHFVLSAVAFSIAVLTKESAVFFLPAFIYIIYCNSQKYHRNIAILKWVGVVFSLISLYFLYAFLKGELFPSGSLLGGIYPHVSLIETVQYQASRAGGFFLKPDSSFMLNFREWINGGYFITVPDPVILIAGVIATVFLFGASIYHKKLRFVFLLTLCYWLFLLRGGEVIGFYIIPLIPFLALGISILIQAVMDLASRLPFGKVGSWVVFVVLIFPFGWYYANHLDVYVKDQTRNQIEAVNWIKQNISNDSIILIDNYAFVDLRAQIPKSFSVVPGAQYYWKADKDPEIKINLLKNNWRNIDYILVTPQMKYDIYHADLDFIKEAHENSTTEMQFPGMGYDIEIKRVKENEGILSKSWDFYKHKFGSEDGAIFDPRTEFVTSEAQAYSLLRSVWRDDKTEFDRVWKWTDDKLRREDRNLFAWLYGQKEKTREAGFRDKGTATDADQDIAFALLLAYKKWGKQYYYDQAKEIVDDIWKFETTEIKGKRYVVAGDWASSKKNKQFTINPSYLMPYAYRIFAVIDKDHNWEAVTDSSYEILQSCSELTLGEGEGGDIPPDWCALDQDGNIIRAVGVNSSSTNYSYDAIRTLWRVALDYHWNKEPRALKFLQKMDLWLREWKENQKIFASYSHGGKPINEGESLAHYGTQLAFFSIIDSSIADQIYKQKILSQWNEEGFWGDRNNYYDQNWVWFGTALYTNNLINFWASD